MRGSERCHTTLDCLDPVLDADALRDLRRTGVDQHELGTIVSGGRYRLTEPDNHHVIWAVRDVIADQWAVAAGRQVERPGVLANVARPWMLATPDRRVLGCPMHPDGCGLDVQLGDPPAVWTCMNLWVLAVTGWDAVHVARVTRDAVEFGAAVERDEERQEALVELVERTRSGWVAA